ncbi:hypothetical protein [Pseudaestuariivita atlantica]|uniref:Sulfotransferase family protein n=1 Tax=Pseudaestuariivita atlantica TaxID=1317121 RepID=A0A0L1JKI4_9RHOB|nr:hypothetical protein [Pseudaestuariivita atlantica]KNG92227.1 hypothetical protein ATO11_18365 [Pseudaestuariivita atlantica]
MQVLLHIGMGKTGTSSIQRALKASEPRLAEQKTHYLGMWFDMVAPRFHGIEGLRLFLEQDEDAKRAGCDKFIAHMTTLAASTGAEKFIFSNEDLFGRIDQLAPVIARLREEVDLRLIMYVRDIHSWLPSAFTQWGLRHKVREGKLAPYAEQAGSLINNYVALRPWFERYGDIMTVRHHQKSIDVVEDFAEVAGITLDPPEGRVLERAEDAEVLLRALFNNKFRGEVFPDRFNRTVLHPARDTVVSVEEAVDDYLDYTATDDIIAPYLDQFRELEKMLDVPFLSGADREQKRADPDALRARLLDYLLAIVLRQSINIQALQRQVRELEQGRDEAAE